MKTLILITTALFWIGCSCEAKHNEAKKENKEQTAQEKQAGAAHKSKTGTTPEARAASGSGDIRDDAIPGYKKDGK